ncbi:MAG: MazG nucleotide pyrophosphohydrolase [Patescibacteria group bacterium]|nr:MazG nucleotide pyrophosphohydrolase [Patescibacteria group bacterium]
MAIKESQDKIDSILKERGWKYWSPLSQLARLTEETGELARVYNHIYGDKPKKLEEPKQSLSAEMGDILYTIICMANNEGINLDEALGIAVANATGRDKDRWKED